MSEPVLSLAGVSVTFHRGGRHLDRVLWDVDLEVSAGEVVAVLSSRAQGKTTLLRVAAGMIRPDRGDVLLEGRNVWELGRRRERVLSRGIAVVRNSAPETRVPVLAGIATPLMTADNSPAIAIAQANRILERVGAAECADQLWEELADWERALVLIARGIARGPALLLVDDVTASLGLGEVDDFGQLVRALAVEQQLAVVMAVSDTSATNWAHRLATLAGGELTEPPPVGGGA